jgi:hypothetical protein
MAARQKKEEPNLKIDKVIIIKILLKLQKKVN